MKPELFELFGYPIGAYGFFVGTAFVVCWHVTFAIARPRGLATPSAKIVIVITLLAALFVSRVLYLLVNPDRWAGLASLNPAGDGGLVAYGGYIGGLAAAWIGLRRIDVDFWKLADCVAPSLALGLAIVRCGCFLNGCDYGCVTEVPWGVRFPVESPAFSEHLARGLVEASGSHSLPVHPTQIYAVGYGVLLAGVLLVRVLRGTAFHGQAFLMFFLTYPLLRFVNELLRDDPQRGGFAGLSTSQWISLSIVPIAAVFYHRRKTARSTI